MTSSDLPQQPGATLWPGALAAAAMFLALAIGLALFAPAARADGPLSSVNHVIIVMQENHSFDNYFGVLAYAKNSPYHAPTGNCPPSDHQCIDALTCSRDATGTYRCSNSNVDDDGSTVFAFHDSNYCPAPDLDHGWPASHHEGNFDSPNQTLASSPNDGFVLVNDVTEQKDGGIESALDDDTIGFYNEDDLPFYYSLAEQFGTDDRYFCDVVGPTVPNRFYLAAATSFGHLTTNELLPPPGRLQAHHRHHFRPARRGRRELDRLLFRPGAGRRLPQSGAAPFRARDAQLLRRRRGGESAAGLAGRSAARWRNQPGHRRASAARYPLG